MISGTRNITVAIHGILTGQTNPDWCDHLDAFMSGAKVIKKTYRAGPFPMWNVWVKNPWVARSLAREIALHFRDGKNGTDGTNGNAPRLHFVAHSNGTDIAVRTIQELAGFGILTDTAVLIAGVVKSDIFENGVRDLIADGALKNAVACWSDADHAVGMKIKWPYGNLGVTGFTERGYQIHRRAYQRGVIQSWKFQDYGHSTYFDPVHRAGLFRQIANLCEVGTVEDQAMADSYVREMWERKNRRKGGRG